MAVGPWHGVFFAPTNPIEMTTLQRLSLVPALAALILVGTGSGCKGGKKITSAGTKVEMPFTGSKYESNNRFFRGTGVGVSTAQNISRSKSDLDAKNQLAGQVGTNMRSVADQYLGETGNAQASEVADKFQSLVREVMSTQLADLRKIGEETRFNETTKDFTTYTAYEIKKAAMFRFMKKQARINNKIDEAQLKIMDEILDQQIKAAETEGE